MRELLTRLLDECPICRNTFNQNVALIAEVTLSDEQVEAVLAHLMTTHAEHDGP